jgi:hypothetical protein
MCHYLPFKLHKMLRQNSKTLKVLHQRKSLGNPDLGSLRIIEFWKHYLKESENT